MSEIRMVKFNTSTLKVEIEDKSKNHSSYLDPNFGLFYALCFLISIATFAADVFMHCWLAYLFHSKGLVLYFFLTVIFIIIPSIVSTGFSMRWYILDEDDELSPAKPSFWKWCLRILTMLLQISQIHRYCDALVYGIRSSIAGYRKQKIKQDYLYRKMLDEDCDAALLRLFYCVLNSAPQGVLQLTILLHRKIKECTTVESFSQTDKCYNGMFEYQCISIWISIISVAWSLTMYDRTVRYIREDKKILSFFGTVLNFLSQITWAVSRIMTLSILAVLSLKLALLGIVLHGALMSVWLLFKPDLNHNKCDECVLNCMLGVAYVFIYISSHTGPQRYSYFWYYTICLTESIVCSLAWYHCTSVPQEYLHSGVIVLQLSSFFCSLFLYVLYYKCFHPNLKCCCQNVYRIDRGSKTINNEIS